MHTTTYEGPDRGDPVISFNHNGDYSGDVIITSARSTDEAPGYESLGEVRVPFEAILQLMSEYLMSEMVARLENMTPNQLFAALVDSSIPWVRED